MVRPKLHALAFLLASLIVFAGCGDEASPESAARTAIGYLRDGNWESYEAMAVNQADVMEALMGTTGLKGSYTRDVLRPQDARRIRGEFDRVAASGILKRHKPGEYELTMWQREDEMWFIEILEPNGDPTGVQLHLLPWNETFKITMAVLEAR